MSKLRSKLIRFAASTPKGPERIALLSLIADDKVKVKRKDTGKVVEVSRETLKENGGDYEKLDGDGKDKADGKDKTDDKADGKDKADVAAKLDKALDNPKVQKGLDAVAAAKDAEEAAEATVTLVAGMLAGATAGSILGGISAFGPAGAAAGAVLGAVVAWVNLSSTMNPADKKAAGGLSKLKSTLKNPPAEVVALAKKIDDGKGGIDKGKLKAELEKMTEGKTALHKLRSKLIRLASSMRGADRKALLTILADETDTGWNTMLQMQKQIEEEELDKPDTFAQHLAVLKSLRKGDRVEITYNDPQRGGKVSTMRVVSFGWAELRKKHGDSFRKPQVLLRPFRGNDATKGGNIKDPWGRRRMMWQATMLTKYRPVLELRKR